MTHPGGRPLKFKSPEELQQRIDEYFKSVEEPRVSGDTVWFEPITITGLALALDTSRQTLCDYDLKDEFTDTIKRAKLRCENYAEKMLYMGKSAAGPIFALKNFDWTDKQDVDITSKGESIAPAHSRLSELKDKINNASER